MDLDWCLTCSQHTSGTLYCSDGCRDQDISYSTKLTESSYSFYSKSITPPPSPLYNDRPSSKTTRTPSSLVTPPSSPPSSTASHTSQISAAILDEPQSNDSSYQSSNDESLISSQYTKTHPWINQRQQQRRLSILT